MNKIVHLLALLSVLCVPVNGLLNAQNAGELVAGRGGMAVSACPLATEAGVNVLRNGGNAVDAAVAMGFVLAVTYPSAGNLGGGSFILIRTADGRTTAIDARETAPSGAHRDMYLHGDGSVRTNASLRGPLAAGTPGTVDGFLRALEQYGSMTREEVLRPAYHYARDGFVPHPRLRALLQKYADSFRLYTSTSRCFLPGGKVPRKSVRWRQRDLARSIERIIISGRDGFYRGETARSIAEAMRRDGGLITEEDLANYRSVQRVPLRGSYRGLAVLSMPPPSSGGIALLQMLGVLENYPRLIEPRSSALTAHVMTEVMRRAFADRAVFGGDPEYTVVPVDSLLSASTVAAWYEAIDTARATPSTELHGTALPVRESDNTTHFAVMDARGNAVCVTTTLNSTFGGYYVVPGTGVLLNNEMDDFSVKPGAANQFGLLGSEANSIAPGKRMLSSMTPTIVLKDGKPWLLTGSPGGSKIITSVLQTILNIVAFDMPLHNAIAAPRFHHQWYPDRIEYESGALAPEVRIQLSGKGHTLKEVQPFGRVEGILYDATTGIWYGCSDPRGYGKAKAVKSTGTSN
ncbi:MAG: gamma-glutamyltransferase [Bacteroidia bacterium]|nr:gamma-glutamyltransferase [Bacteroidia bacterium]